MFSTDAVSFKVFIVLECRMQMCEICEYRMLIVFQENSSCIMKTLFFSEKDQSKEKEKKVKKTIPSWATLSASQLARAQKQTPMASSPRPKMDAILTEAIKASCYFMQSTQVCLLRLSLFESSLFCPDVRNPALMSTFSPSETGFFCVALPVLEVTL